MTRAICQEAIDLVKRCESFAPTAYLCPGGKPTIGYGHTAGVLAGDVGNRRITEAMAEQLLRDDLADAAAAVERLVKVSLTDNEFGALVSFVFNVGAGDFKQSTLLRKLNQSAYSAVPLELEKWHHANGKDLAGLVARRAAEGMLFLGWRSIGPVANVKPILDAAARAAVAWQNTERVDAARAEFGGSVPEFVGAAAHTQAAAVIVEAVRPFLDGGAADIAIPLHGMVRNAIVDAVDYWKLPMASAIRLPD